MLEYLSSVASEEAFDPDYKWEKTMNISQRSFLQVSTDKAMIA